MSELEECSLSKKLEAAETELTAALKQYASVVSLNISGLAEEAVASRKKSNAFRLEVMLPRYQHKIQSAFGGFCFSRDGIILESDGCGENYCYKDPKTGANCVTTLHFGEPDGHYLRLLREALGSKVKVHVTHNRGFLGNPWLLWGKWTECPEEHRQERKPRRRGKRR